MDQEAKIRSQSKDLFDRKSVRWILYLIVPAVIFALVCSAIRVSQMGIDHTILIFGQKELLAGGPAALRISLVADDGRFFLPDELSGYISRGNERTALFKGYSSDTGYALACNFEVPEMKPGPAELELDIGFDDKRRNVKTKIEIVAKPPDERLEIPEDATKDPGPNTAMKGDNTIRISTEDRGAPTGLTSVAFLRSANAQDEPVRETVEIELLAVQNKEEATKTVATDGVGLFAFPVKPLELSYPIKLVSARPISEAPANQDGGPDAEKQDAVLYPRIVYAGITCQLHNPIVAPGSPLRVSFNQISNAGPVYADIFHRGRWVQASSAWQGGGKADLEIRPRADGLGRLQITTSAIAPGRTIAVRHFYVLKEGENQADGLKAILKALAEKDRGDKWAGAVLDRPLGGAVGFDKTLAAAYALSKLYAGHQPIPMLVSSRRDDDDELNQFKTGYQRMAMIAIVLLGLGVASLIAMIAVQARGRQRRLTAMILEDNAGDEGGEWHTDVGEKTSKRRVLLQGLVLFVIIMGAFASIAVLIDTLRWFQL